MEEELSKKLSVKLILWLLGIIAALLVGAVGGGFKFYTDWTADEAVEDAQKEMDKSLMFKDPAERESVIDHVEETPPALEQKLKIERDIDFQKAVLKKLDESDSLNKRLNDQYYQLNKKIDHIH